MTASRWSGIVFLCAKAIPVFLFASMLFGCLGGPPVRIQPLPMTQLSVPEDKHYKKLAWLAPDLLIVNYDTNKIPDSLGMIHPSESGLVPIDLPPDPDPDCRHVEFGDPIQLSDGRLGFVRSCPTVDSYGIGGWRMFLLAWDPQTQNTEPLIPYMYPWEGKYITATYAPDLSRGVAGDFVSIEDHLHWLERDGVHPLDVGMVRANRPQWSPDGQWIAFTGDKTMQGGPGPDWAGQLYDLWLMPASCDHEGKPCKDSLQRILPGIEPVGLQWSPDSKRIAFGGYLSGQPNGVWILDVATGSLTQIATGDYAVPAWSPDGRQIAVVGPEVPDNPNDPVSTTGSKTLYVIDVSGLK